MANATHIVGLTGGMGAGKSTVLPVAQEMGITVYDFDKAVRDAYKVPDIANSVGRLFGLEPPVTKAMVAEAVVRDPTLLPAVERTIMQHIEVDLGSILMMEPRPFLLIDAPMLIEMKWHRKCDFVIAVMCDTEVREKRVMQRPGMTVEKMNLLMSRQVDDATRESMANFGIYNHGTIEDAQVQMRNILTGIIDWYSKR